MDVWSETVIIISQKGHKNVAINGFGNMFKFDQL